MARNGRRPQAGITTHDVERIVEHVADYCNRQKNEREVVGCHRGAMEFLDRLIKLTDLPAPEDEGELGGGNKRRKRRK